ncbi:hypothetical protein TP2_17935 [Thioclava pacifica DSM 10166]|uniref:Uncharacterized protein n=2 Tax=Thioclava pacifica TaxID=285109 RepID=A0A074J7C6_9RHOB|nr:hypothetical protein TP2_17935 [Thioclava pacifica DSM 10166]
MIEDSGKGAPMVPLSFLCRVIARSEDTARKLAASGVFEIKRGQVDLRAAVAGIIEHEVNKRVEKSRTIRKNSKVVWKRRAELQRDADERRDLMVEQFEIADQIVAVLDGIDAELPPAVREHVSGLSRLSRRLRGLSAPRG